MWMVNVVFSGRSTEPGDPATRTVKGNALQRTTPLTDNVLA
jgi:hypothetical protein